MKGSPRRERNVFNASTYHGDVSKKGGFFDISDSRAVAGEQRPATGRGAGRETRGVAVNRGLVIE